MTTLRTIYILKTIICIQVVSIAVLLIRLRENSSNNWMPTDIALGECHEDVSDGPRVQPPVLQFIYKYDWSRHRNKLTVFNRLGYQTRQRITNPSDWDVAWIHASPPFVTLNRLPEKTILPFQKINHVPFIGLIVDKKLLVPEGGKYIPLAYRMPDEKHKFIKEVKSNPRENRTWVQKNPSHRGVQVRKTEDLNLDRSSIIQEFIDNPLLIDGYKFNMGVFVMITSVTPLRAYEAISAGLRICTEKYIPRNYSNVATYVTDITNNSRGSLEFPDAARFHDLQYTDQRVIEILLEKEGANLTVVLQQAREAIRDVLLSRIGRIRQRIPRGLVGMQNTFFDLSRWDTLLDDQMRLHLIEANLSPDIEFGGDSYRNSLESYIFNALRLALVADVHKHGAASSSVKNIRDSDLNAGISICLDSACSDCDYKDCYLCSHCVSKERRYMLKLAYAEHINSNRFRRVYPEAMTQDEALDYDITIDEDLLDSDRILRAWYRAKCIGNTYWCG